MKNTDKDGFWKWTQLNMANIFLAVGIILLFLKMPTFSSGLDTALFFASAITLFYFWWGYIFLTSKNFFNDKIEEWLFDFTAVSLLFYLISLTQMWMLFKATVWLAVYLLLFIMAIIKYVMIHIKTKETARRAFIVSKIKTDMLAGIIILACLVLSAVYGFQLLAIWLIFAMELGHILYVAFVSKVYDR